MPKSTKPPWRRANPRKRARKKRLGKSGKAAAKRRASRAGRPYPNLVDNMAAARRRKTKRRKRTSKR